VQPRGLAKTALARSNNDNAKYGSGSGFVLEVGQFHLFLVAAFVIAITPGPGIFYVAARTLKGGRRDGLASSIGTGLGGLVHIFAGALGVSALVMTSAEAFSVLKLCGAAYLIWLGLKTIREAQPVLPASVEETGLRHAFREGLLVEALNPKTATFFLAFVPQFIDPSQHVASQFALLGAVSVALNTAIDVLVVYSVGRARAGMEGRPNLIKRLREGSGFVMCALGASLLFARRPS
jgi:threonine/homoserine/homoserine lactone efflux protein